MVKPPFIRSPYNYDVKEASDSVMIADGGPSLTVQSQSEDADINVLMKRYGILGKFPDNPYVPQYADFTGVTDFRSALHAMQDAAEAFMLYPADFRARFQNDPQNFLTFCENPANIPEMRKLGLFKAEVSDGKGHSGPAPTGVESRATGEGASPSGGNAQQAQHGDRGDRAGANAPASGAAPGA